MSFQQKKHIFRPTSSNWSESSRCLPPCGIEHFNKPNQLTLLNTWKKIKLKANKCIGTLPIHSIKKTYAWKINLATFTKSFQGYVRQSRPQLCQDGNTSFYFYLNTVVKKNWARADSWIGDCLELLVLLVQVQISMLLWGFEVSGPGWLRGSHCSKVGWTSVGLRQSVSKQYEQYRCEANKNWHSQVSKLS